MRVKFNAPREFKLKIKGLDETLLYTKGVHDNVPDELKDHWFFMAGRQNGVIELLPPKGEEVKKVQQMPKDIPVGPAHSQAMNPTPPPEAPKADAKVPLADLVKGEKAETDAAKKLKAAVIKKPAAQSKAQSQAAREAAKTAKQADNTPKQ